MKTLDVCLIIVALVLLAFTVTMIWIFCRYYAIPDTLCTCVFAALTGELGVCGWIKTAKVHAQDRREMLEDEKRMEEKYGKTQ